MQRRTLTQAQPNWEKVVEEGEFVNTSAAYATMISPQLHCKVR
jgi:hypothetical protein